MEGCGRSARQSAGLAVLLVLLACVGCSLLAGPLSVIEASSRHGSLDQKRAKEEKQGRNKSKHKFLLPVVRLCFASFFTVCFYTNFKLHYTASSPSNKGARNGLPCPPLLASRSSTKVILPHPKTPRRRRNDSGSDGEIGTRHGLLLRTARHHPSLPPTSPTLRGVRKFVLCFVSFFTILFYKLQFILHGIVAIQQGRPQWTLSPSSRSSISSTKLMLPHPKSSHSTTAPQ